MLHMGCPLKQWAVQWTGAAHCLCELIIISAHGLPMGHNNYTVVANASWEDIYIVRKSGSKAVPQQKTSNCVVMLEAGI